MAYEEKMVEVSVIFVNYNATDMLIEAIRSVKKHTQHVSYELIVVDNASPDRGIQRIKDTFEEEIKVIISTRNLGFGGANNLGVAEAKGKYVFFLNPDTLLLNDVISLLYAYCENNADKGLVRWARYCCRKPNCQPILLVCFFLHVMLLPAD